MSRPYHHTETDTLSGAAVSVAPLASCCFCTCFVSFLYLVLYCPAPPLCIGLVLCVLLLFRCVKRCTANGLSLWADIFTTKPKEVFSENYGSCRRSRPRPTDAKLGNGWQRE